MAQWPLRDSWAASDAPPPPALGEHRNGDFVYFAVVWMVETDPSTPGTSRSVLKMHTWILTRALMTTWINHDQQKVACSHVATVTFCIRNCPRNVCYTSLASTFAYLFKSNAVGIVFVTRQHTLSIAVLITNTSMDARKLDSAVCLHASCVSTMFLTFVAIFVRNLSESSLPRFTCLRPVHALFCIC